MDSVLIQIVVNSFVAAALYTLVGLGFSLLYKVVKFFDFSYGVIIPFAGYMMYWFFHKIHFSFFSSLCIALLLSASLSFFIYHLVYRTLKKRGASRMSQMIASLGVLTSVQAILAMLFTSQFRTIRVDSLSHSITLLGASITYIQIVSILLSIILFILIFFLIHKSHFGVKVRAVSDDEEVAQIVGIRYSSIVSTIFLLSGLIGGIVGIIVGIDIGLEPHMGMQLLLSGVVAMIIGGESIFGIAAGSLFLAFIENVVVWYLSGEWKSAVAFSILILFLLFVRKNRAPVAS